MGLSDTRFGPVLRKRNRNGETGIFVRKFVVPSGDETPPNSGAYAVPSSAAMVCSGRI
jgi:hypothetical protein